ncbi:hypothetical protein KC340_g1449 [Hortaea werneckii]|nr:hypothetical protein KC342_g1487 [Hortaea werneckii]KAI7107451.1 hypothetical protein KC339_g2343 [Hortaea werneckii]KAI7243297.1 hypothetical protein KC365_g2404 [Hortaea werneckii]KAI7336897.1 hypothetical protein KC340_g1449 [Hortaea werneckii]KAI7397466.1 hypothetical protein KC328_g4890 [Hortaea werneckii]
MQSNGGNGNASGRDGKDEKQDGQQDRNNPIKWDPMTFKSMTPQLGAEGDPVFRPRYLPPVIRSTASNGSTTDAAQLPRAESVVYDDGGGVSLLNTTPAYSDMPGQMNGYAQHPTYSNMSPPPVPCGFNGVQGYGYPPPAGAAPGYPAIPGQGSSGRHTPSPNYMYAQPALATRQPTPRAGNTQSLISRSNSSLSTNQYNNPYANQVTNPYPNQYCNPYATKYTTSSGAARGNNNHQTSRLAAEIMSGAMDFGDLERKEGVKKDSARPTPLYSNRERQVLPQKQIRSTTTANPHTEMLPLGSQPPNTSSVMAVRERTSRPKNTIGNAAAYLKIVTVRRPAWLDGLRNAFKPTIETLVEAMPFMEACRYASPSTAAVVHLMNIPYGTPRSEILAFVGRNAAVCAQPAGSPYYAVHIIMERFTAKTMDAFVELENDAEARCVINHCQRRIDQGRQPRLGDRTVSVDLSSQEELMSELFPRAKNVLWDGASPVVSDHKDYYYPSIASNCFAGFLQPEEVIMVTKHVETPHRSPYAARALVRVYESWISTLHKYPWHAHDHVLLTERQVMFDATVELLRHLLDTLNRNKNTLVEQGTPTDATLMEFAVAVLTCPGFSEGQKAHCIHILRKAGYDKFTTPRGMNLAFGGTSTLSAQWPFQVIVREPRVHDDLVTYLASLCHRATVRDTNGTSMHDRLAARANGTGGGPFGNIQIDYKMPNNELAKTLAEAGKIEMDYVEKLLERVLPRQA